MTVFVTSSSSPVNAILVMARASWTFSISRPPQLMERQQSLAAAKQLRELAGDDLATCLCVIERYHEKRAARRSGPAHPSGQVPPALRGTPNEGDRRSPNAPSSTEGRPVSQPSSDTPSSPRPRSLAGYVGILTKRGPTSV
jgi:hypothetical protein